MCTVKAVKAPKAAEINDELATKFGAEDLAALKTQIGERLEAEYTGAARAVMKRALLDELDKAVSFDLPPSLLDAEAKQIAHQLWHEENPDVEGHDHPEIEPTDEHNTLRRAACVWVCCWLSWVRRTRSKCRMPSSLRRS